jgi:hypothetical protein
MSYLSGYKKLTMADLEIGSLVDIYDDSSEVVLDIYDDVTFHTLSKDGVVMQYCINDVKSLRGHVDISKELKLIIDKIKL